MRKRSQGGLESPTLNTILLERTSETTQSNRYACSKYQPEPGAKRCVHYVGNGGCALPGEFMCVEWLRANRPSAGKSVSPISPPRQIFQLEVQAPLAIEAKPTAPVNVAVHDARMALPAIPADDIAAFKSAGVEVRLAIGDGAVYLVPEYTQQERIELSVEHAATLRRLLDSFPGARIAKLSRVPSAKEPRHG